MMLVNKTKNVVIAESAEIASSLGKRLKGLLGRKELKKGQAMLLKPCSGVHSLFMRFSIDVLFVDKNNRVIDVLSFFRPWRFSPFYFNSAYAVELPAGTASPALVSLGDTLSLV
jgi:uncharacterized membrane protein (UPF0127 family)